MNLLAVLTFIKPTWSASPLCFSSMCGSYETMVNPLHTNLWSEWIQSPGWLSCKWCIFTCEFHKYAIFCRMHMRDVSWLIKGVHRIILQSTKVTYFIGFLSLWTSYKQSIHPVHIWVKWVIYYVHLLPFLPGNTFFILNF